MHDAVVIEQLIILANLVGDIGARLVEVENKLERLERDSNWGQERF